jgi:hypothetical protein
MMITCGDWRDVPPQLMISLPNIIAEQERRRAEDERRCAEDEGKKTRLTFEEFICARHTLLSKPLPI